jgi:hypothetical protein
MPAFIELTGIDIPSESQVIRKADPGYPVPIGDLL